MGKAASCCCCAEGLQSLRAAKTTRNEAPRRTIGVTEYVRDRLQSTMARKGTLHSCQRILVCSDPRRSVDKSYKTMGLLGEGGFGKVYKVQHIESGEYRALKQILKAPLADTGDLDRIGIELEVMVKLDHPHIIRLYEFFEDAESLYMAVELCEQGDFEDLRTYEPTEMRRLYMEMMLAVAFCHDREIAHRDLKLENCLLQLVGNRCTTKIIDFGLSSVRRSGDTQDGWITGKIGTPVFLAPEVFSDAPYGLQCDCWSAGVMLYIIFTDEHPIIRKMAFMEGEHFAEEMKKRCVRQDPLNQNDVDDEARDFLMKLLRKNPNERMSARSALEHPFLKQERSHKTYKTWAEKEGYTPLPTLMERVHAFSTFSRFEKAVLMLTAHQAKQDEVANMTEVFNELDADKNGCLTKQEILAGLRAYGQNISEEQFDREYGLTHLQQPDGRVNYTEWLAASTNRSLLASDKALKEAFRFFDIDSDGLISKKDLLLVLGEDDRAVLSAFENEACGDGKVLDEAAFLRLMRNVGNQVRAETPVVPSRTTSSTLPRKPLQKDSSPSRFRSHTML